jgi:Tol biopolymer transport system component
VAGEEVAKVRRFSLFLLSLILTCVLAGAVACPVAVANPSLTPLLPGLEVSVFYTGVGCVGDGILPLPDGSLLVVTQSCWPVQQGLYIAHEGDACGPEDAYAPTGDPLWDIDDFLLHSDGRVFLAANGPATIWLIPSPGAAPEVFTTAIHDPFSILVAPSWFDGTNVNPGDFLIASNGGGTPELLGLYVMDQNTMGVHKLVGSPELDDGLLDICFGPDGTLYASQNDDRHNGVRIVKISPEGEVTPVLDNYVVWEGEKQGALMGINPVTGEIYFSSAGGIYRTTPDGSWVEPVASGVVSALAFSADGATLYAGAYADGEVVKITGTLPPLEPTPPGTGVSVTVGGCAVTYDLVLSGGNTYVRDTTELPSGDPLGYPVAGYGWQIGTTAALGGGVTVTVQYDNSLIPAGQEETLSLVRWDGSQWVDTTVARDAVNNTVTGQSTSLGLFSICAPYPTLPELPGKLVFGAASRDWQRIDTMQYSTDPVARDCVVGDTWGADWSPDGSKLVYSDRSGSFWILDVEAGIQVHIPSIYGAEPRWAPDGNRICYDHWMPGNMFDVRVANVDGTGETVVSHAIEGWNGHPVWSPDGQWIAYRHPDPPGQKLWLVRYDGTEAHPVIATGLDGFPGYEVVNLDTPAWSPEGTKLAVLCVVQDSEGVESWGIAVISRDGGIVKPVFFAPSGVVCCAAPNGPWWSPDGTTIVFGSGHHVALPPPVGALDLNHELWLVNADGTGDPIRLTYDDRNSAGPSWWAPNTLPSEPGGSSTVVKGDTTVTLESVTESGSTSVCVTNEPPGPTPEGFEFLGDYYDIGTTAQLAQGSKITIQIHYDDADVPGGQEEWLSLLHWETDHWVDITVRPIDTVNNVITGECYSLSEFGIAFGPQFQGLLPPVNNDNTSIFKLKSTVPVKFRLTDPDGTSLGNAVAKLYVAKATDQVVGTYVEAESMASADSGNTFRYDTLAGQYIFNLGTKSLSTGSYSLRVEVNSVVMKEVLISLK